MRGKILFDQQSRYQFDRLRNNFRTQNDSARFARQFSYSVSQFKYAISPLGSYNIGQTIDFISQCKKLGIEYKLQQKLKKNIFPRLYIDQIKSVPNTKYTYRDYQQRLLTSLCKYGRGVIVSPTRSGKSLILSRIMS